MTRTRQRFVALCESDIQVYVDHGDDREEAEERLWDYVCDDRGGGAPEWATKHRELIARYYRAVLEVSRQARLEAEIERVKWARLDEVDEETRAAWLAHAFPSRCASVRAEPAVEQELTPGDHEFIEALRTVDPGTYELFRGQWDRRGYKSQSEADFALLGKLRRYGCNRQRLRRLFLASGLCRPKTRSRRGRTDYLNFTIGKLLAREAAR